MMTTKKLTKQAFINVLSDIPEDRIILGANPIPTITVDMTKNITLGSKKIFSIRHQKALSKYQENISKSILCKIELSNSAIAYVRGKSYLDFLEPHRRGYHFLRLDIKSFFHSIREDLVKEVMSSYISNQDFYGNEQSILEAFVNLVMMDVSEDYQARNLSGRKILPIEFKSSPALSNIVFRKFDNLIQNFCSNNGVSYTRYADDMLFSAPATSSFVHSDRFENEMSFILKLGDFKINRSKTIKSSGRISINGYVIDAAREVNELAFLKISNKKTDLILKLLYKLDRGECYKAIMKKHFGLSVNKIGLKYPVGKNKFTKQYYHSQVINVLAGYRSYLISFLKYNGRFFCLDPSCALKLETILQRIERHLLKIQ